MVFGQLAMFVARKIAPRRPTAQERIALAFWSFVFDWRDSLFVVQPETLIRWQRKLVRLDWAWISKVWTRRAATGRKPRNHVDVTVACDFATVPTVLCKYLYVFVVMELGSRRVLHVNATAHPTNGR